MQRGYLSQCFVGIAFKRLSKVEVDKQVSNQHEFNGSKPIRNLLGDEKQTLMSRFLWIPKENESISAEGTVTWYDAREQHPIRSEYRLYFQQNEVMDEARGGDLLIIAKRPTNELLLIIVPSDSTLENQLLWLFGIEKVGNNFNYKPIANGHDPEIDFAVRYILEELEIEIEEPDATQLDTILEPYLATGFPRTAEFSKLARESLVGVSPIEAPDATIIQWMEQEEKLFKRLERYLVAERLRKGFEDEEDTDVEGFIEFSLSVQNRRKSRVGHALENHLEEVFKVHDVLFSRGKVTENKSKPDFLFPNIESYHNEHFPVSNLTMLGVKSTCKDRWRQVLAEADRIKAKHLFTLEPSISEYQTNEMDGNHLQLVLPEKLHETYKPQQRDWLMNLDEFLQLVKQREL